MRKCVVLLFLWFSALPLLYHLTAFSNLTPESSPSAGDDFASSPRSGAEFGAFATAYYNPDYDYRPEVMVRFDGLCVSGRSLGLFRTALHNDLRIDNLSLRVFTYDDQTAQRQTQVHDDDLPGREPDGLLSSAQLERLLDWRLYSQTNFPDISKSTQISIHGFAFDWQAMRQPQLSIQSRRAVYDIRRPDEIVLLGRVILKTPSRKIESNRVVWNTEGRFFAVQGRYYLSTGEASESGRTIEVDYKLVESNKNTETHTQKGGSLCLADS